MKDTKYIVSCICKDEAAYIEEFIKYHLDLGFDQIIIGDNNDIDSKDNYVEQLKTYIKADKVIIYDLRGKRNMQLPFYNYILDNIEFDWCATIDCDEFITFNKDAQYNDIKSFLNSNENIKAYGLNWMVYGDNEHITKTNKGVIETFTEPMPKDFKYHYDFPENSHIKSIIHKSVNKRFISNPHNVEDCEYSSPSGTKFKGPFNYNIDYSILYIRHYYTKSLEEWIDKKMKSFGANLSGINQLYNISDFFIYNKMTLDKQNYLKDRNIYLNLIGLDKNINI